MTDRVHAALDGELPRTALNEQERARLDELTRSIADTAAALRASPTPDLAGAVMRGIEEKSHASAAATRPAEASRGTGLPALGQVFAWLWRPRSVSLAIRPAYAFAGLMIMIGATAMAATRLGERPELPAIAAAAPESDAPSFYVQFRIEADGATRVALAGSFTDWEPRYSLEQLTPGVWTVMVPLDPGVHDYTFVIDGERWVVDPYAPRVADSFGGSNSRLFLAATGDAT